MKKLLRNIRIKYRAHKMLKQIEREMRELESKKLVHTNNYLMLMREHLACEVALESLTK